MAYLIDTQILIWSISNPSKLSTSTNDYLKKATIFVSQISLFEIAIKQKIGKLIEIDLTLPELINQIQSDGYQILWLKTPTLLPTTKYPFLLNTVTHLIGYS